MSFNVVRVILNVAGELLLRINATYESPLLVFADFAAVLSSFAFGNWILVPSL